MVPTLVLCGEKVANNKNTQKTMFAVFFIKKEISVGENLSSLILYINVDIY